MTVDPVALGQRLRRVREDAGASPEHAAEAIDATAGEYRRIEAGERVVLGSELVALADSFGVRAGVVVSRGNAPDGDALADRVLAYFELDRYLAAHGLV